MICRIRMRSVRIIVSRDFMLVGAGILYKTLVRTTIIQKFFSVCKKIPSDVLHLQKIEKTKSNKTMVNAK